MKPLMERLPVMVLIADACPPIFMEGFGNIVTSGFGSGMILRNTIFFILSLIININAWPSKLNQK